MSNNIQLKVAPVPAPLKMRAIPVEIVNAVSPTIDAERVPGGVELTIQDVHGTEQVMVYDGPPGTNDYNDVINKPRINDVELQGDKSSNQLKLQGMMDEVSNADIDNILFGGMLHG